MNDAELDDLLNQWKVPPPPPSLRANVLAGFVATMEQRPRPGRAMRWIAPFVPGARKSLFAAAALCAGLLVLVVTQALPQTPPIDIPYTVDSEFVRYADDGSSSVEMYLTSYTAQNGAETLVSRSMPNRPFGTALGRTLDAALPAWQHWILPFTVSSADLERIRKSRPPSIGFITGCADWTCLTLNRYFFRKAASAANGCLDGTVVARETILGYPTTAVELRLWQPRRITVWTAPGLGCFALRITSEAQPAGGSFHLENVKQAVAVKMPR
jgi:hypothetical protein